MYKLEEADLALKQMYLDAAADILKIKKPNKRMVVASHPIRCRHCGRSAVTLRKCSDGYYICNDCLGKGD
jgi:hypothetical protein